VAPVVPAAWRAHPAFTTPLERLTITIYGTHDGRTYARAYWDEGPVVDARAAEVTLARLWWPQQMESLDHALMALNELVAYMERARDAARVRDYASPGKADSEPA